MEWASNMKSSSYHKYINWFNINVKDENSQSNQEPFFPENHDFKIKTDEFVVNVLKETA